LYRLHLNDQQDLKERKQLNEVWLSINQIYWTFNQSGYFLVETARPSSPSGDQSRQEYRRSGYDKQGEVGGGFTRPEFVSFNV
jgi:hypothetical protein